jgi:hypothetical protein
VLPTLFDLAARGHKTVVDLSGGGRAIEIASYSQITYHHAAVSRQPSTRRRSSTRPIPQRNDQHVLPSTAVGSGGPPRGSLFMLRPIRQCRHLFKSALMKVVEHSASFFGAGSLCTGCLYNSCRAV